MSPGIAAFVLLLGAVRGTLEISNRTLAGAREEGGVGAAFYAETSPGLKLGLSARRWEFSADYTPRLSGSPFGPNPQSYIVQQARLSGRWQEHRASVALSQDAGYGRQSLLSLLSDQAPTPGTTTSLGALPTAEVLDYVWSRTNLVYRLDLSRRWALSLTGETAVNGGVDAYSRAVVPLQTNLRAAIGADFAASRRDRLSLTLDTSRIFFSTGSQDTVLQGKTSWRHDLGRNTTTTLVGGVGWASSQDGGAAPARADVYPVAEASINYQHSASGISTWLVVKVSPVVDRLSSTVDERMESMASILWSATRVITLQGHLGVTASIPWSKPDAISAGFAGASIALGLNDVVQLDGGARAAWATATSAAAPPQWSVFAGITLRVPTLRF